MPRASRTIKAVGVLLAVVVTAVIALQTIAPRRTMMGRYHSATAVYYGYQTPPPSPDGNRFSVLPRWAWLRERYLPWLSRYVGLTTPWTVVNMHAEKYQALSQKLGFQSVLVEKVGEREGTVYCLVVDKRVPRDWLLAKPRVDTLQMRQELRAKWVQYFRENPLAKALNHTTWTMVSLYDPDRGLARLLPGHRIQFGTLELNCESASGAILGRRSWEPGRDEPTRHPEGWKPPRLRFSPPA